MFDRRVLVVFDSVTRRYFPQQDPRRHKQCRRGSWYSKGMTQYEVTTFEGEGEIIGADFVTIDDRGNLLLKNKVEPDVEGLIPPATLVAAYAPGYWLTFNEVVLDRT